MSVFIPNLEQLEKLVPELLRIQLLAIKPRESLTKQQQEQCLKLLKTAAGRWIILRSLYDRGSDYYIPFFSLFFKSATWKKLIFEKLPNFLELTCSDLIFDEYPEWVRDNFISSLEKNYGLSPHTAERLLQQCPLQVSDKTIRNYFTALSVLSPVPLVHKYPNGQYQKVRVETIENFLTDSLEKHLNARVMTRNLQLFNEEGMIDLSFIKQEIASIVELLFPKLQGQQRLFLHHDYIVPKSLREDTVNNADQLKEIWKEKPTPPLKICYYSASLSQTYNYIIYPVCLYYYQRAYYLSAWGQSPHSRHQLQWYNYRLDQIKEIIKLSWQDSQLPFSETKFTKKANNYDPNYIQQQLEKAYGFDFYQPKALALLKFEPDFAQRYINNSFRHDTFEKIEEIEEVISIIEQEDLREKSQLINKVKQASHYSYYLLTYRQNDNSVIMRLRSWSPNVEVLLPGNLRQRMKKDIMKTWQLYQDIST